VATPFAGERIRAAREIFGLTQEALEEAAGVSQSLISQVERGQKDATEDLVKAVADATNLPIEFFDVTPHEIPLDSLRFRKQASASATTTRRARALFHEAYRLSADLVDQVGYHQPTLPVAQGTLEESDIVELAAATREALQLDPERPVPHVMRAVERGGVPVAPIVLPNGDDGATARNRHYGLSYWGGPGDHAFIGYFPGSQGDRDRFTLAHELGHLVLHSKRRSEDPEQEANLFAGEFLMPRDRALEALGPNLNLMDYARLKAKWGISIQGLVMRAKRVGAIDESRSTSLWKQISARGWRLEEPVPVEPEQPALLARLVATAYGEKPASELTRLLALSPILVRSLIPQIAATSRAEGKVLTFPNWNSKG
jgi:Zn-dependent peptidase ImmA (M78 family)/DNA-binding XRE family transcriptional regulator